MSESMFISAQADHAIRRSRAVDGDILVTITGNVGRVVRLSGIPRANINQHIARIRISSPLFDSSFIYHYLSQSTVREYFESITTGQAYPQLSLTQVRDLQIPVIPIAAQESIAEALDTADEKIGILNDLICKKRDVKQGMMQELLTGRTRLPGFTGDWPGPASFVQLCTKASGFWGLSDPSPNASNRVEVITAGDITAQGKIKSASERFFTDAQVSQAHCRPDDLVVTSSGNGLGKTAYINYSCNLAASNFVRILRPRSDVSGAFLAQVMWTPGARSMLDANTATSAYPNLMPTFFTERWIPNPPIDEQRAIATILQDADTEIEALERRLKSARAVKVGIMQELLTGRTRLPVKEEA